MLADGIVEASLRTLSELVLVAIAPVESGAGVGCFVPVVRATFVDHTRSCRVVIELRVIGDLRAAPVRAVVAEAPLHVEHQVVGARAALQHVVLADAPSFAFRRASEEEVVWNVHAEVYGLYVARAPGCAGQDTGVLAHLRSCVEVQTRGAFAAFRAVSRAVVVACAGTGHWGPAADLVSEARALGSVQTLGLRLRHTLLAVLVKVVRGLTRLESGEAR